VTLEGAETAQASFTAPETATVVSFTLTVTDALGLGSTPDGVAVYVEEGAPVNRPPYVPSNPTPADERPG